MFKVLKDKKGVTLIELVAAMGIFAVMTVAVLFVLVPTLKTYDKANELAEVNSIANTIAMEISNELSRAVASPTITDSAANQSIAISVNNNNIVSYSLRDGMLMKSLNGETPYAPLSKSFYKNMKIETSYIKGTLESGEGETYTIQLSILNNTDTALLSREFVVKPIVLNQSI